MKLMLPFSDSIGLVGILVLTAAVRINAEPPVPRTFTEAERSHWAFQKIEPSRLPKARSHAWERSPIDRFVLNKLQARGIAPAAEADRITLLRRASFDITGLPPTPAEVAAFLGDQAPGAFGRATDRLLASPHYGERWARHWLDLARFAESTGFEQDVTRPNAWRYRDYVVDAFNDDKPYDRFLREQIAGDEIWPDDVPSRIATAFLRHYPEEGNNKDLKLARQEILHNITDLVGSVCLGLTFNCAQCHDHKFDSILQEDYYRLQAFFANIGHDDQIPVLSRQKLRTYEQQLAAWEQRTQSLWDEMDALLATVRKYSPQQLLARYPDYVIEAIETTPERRTPIQAQLAYLLEHKECSTCPLKPKPYRDPHFAKDAGKLKGSAKLRFAEIQTEINVLAHLMPIDIPRTMGIIDISDQPPPTFVLGVGLYTSPKQEVQPGFLSILDPSPAVVEPLRGRQSTGRRTALANWLVNPNNPLVARVLVNRVWHYHFGRGIVGTPSDFGNMGDSPTHPLLLDWLAHEFVRSGWSIKHIHRLVMTSAVYRQSSLDCASARSIDPDNHTLWHFQPRRLDAEVIRDSALSVSGLLNSSIGGPSVFPPLPSGRPIPVGGWKVSSNSAEHARRSIYIFVRRNDRYPQLEVFDFPDTHESCAFRQQTITTPQALSLLNGQSSYKRARGFAERVFKEVRDDIALQIDTAYRLAYSRPPEARERQSALKFFRRHVEIIRRDRADQLQSAGSAEDSEMHLAALTDFCLMILNSNEFVYRF